MNKLLKILFVCITLFLGNATFAAKLCKIEYSVPIDYSKIDKNILESQANLLFDHFYQITDSEYRKKYIQPLLNRYSILSVIDPSEPLYFTRLGILYSELGQDTDAKSNFFRATNLCPKYAYASYSFGNYYYDRGYYRKALAKYKAGGDLNYPLNYDRFYKIGSVYEKLANYNDALIYYKSAYKIKNSRDLYDKILLLEDLNKKNVLYHK